MIGFQTSLVIALSFGWVLAGNLKEHLKSANISAVFPGDFGYVNASAPCALSVP
jgi:hypothetical protein